MRKQQKLDYTGESEEYYYDDDYIDDEDHLNSKMKNEEYSERDDEGVNEGNRQLSPSRE